VYVFLWFRAFRESIFRLFRETVSRLFSETKTYLRSAFFFSAFRVFRESDFVSSVTEKIYFTRFGFSLARNDFSRLPDRRQGNHGTYLFRAFRVFREKTLT
jgi:hypothetical protein